MNKPNLGILVFASLICCANNVNAQLPTGWKAHDWNRPTPEIVTPGQSNLPLAAPNDAVVLFDGSSLENWRSANGGEAKWIVKDGVLESVPGSGYLFSAQSFGDCQLHVEWSAPEKVEGNSQGRGNSGVFLMGLYEVQVLDSYDNRTYADGQAGAMYGQFPPLVNAARQPGEWQSYDIVFHQPKFDSSGRLLQPATMTVIHNGVLIQDHTELLGPTAWLKHDDYTPHPRRLPLSFQDHGNPVRYRNIWLRELPESPRPSPAADAYNPNVVSLSDEQLDKIAGKYGVYELKRKGNSLILEFNNRSHEVIPHSATEFSLRYTAATLTLKYDESDNPAELEYSMGGSSTKAKRE